DYIPGYLQPDTQKKLRNTIKKGLGERDRKSGYVYALNVFDPENEGKLSLKIGYTVRAVKKRHADWKAQCRSYIKGVRGWWPETIKEREDDDEVSIQKLLENNMEGVVGPIVVQLERLVHIELQDLATHAPYLRPDFPDVRLSDVQRLSEAAPIKVCDDCKKKHKEIFSFRRVEKGKFFGREWEGIIKPVIRKWGSFLVNYFAEGDVRVLKKTLGLDSVIYREGLPVDDVSFS
ncbi:uncharacterized protein EDB91DRAFT_1047546, partial [Suillus paluster]|uniref:uncharacterized protein n=1 Tax=Suillus paluster TaxID=48578 RepID=UPI001B862C21